MKRRLVFLGVALTAALAVGSVSRSSAAPLSGARADQTIPLLRYGTVGFFASLDPARSTGGNTGLLFGTETLMRFDKGGKVVPNLAASVKQLNPTRYRYTLRRGVKFWDGTEMTAEDVAGALNYQRCLTCVGSRYFTTVRDVRATGRYAVDILLKRRDATFPATMAWAGSVFKKKFQEEHLDTFGRPGTPPVIMGTGPWIINSYDTTRGAEVSANPNYWGGKPKIDRISIKFFRDETSMALAFRAGEIDLAFPGDARAWQATTGTKIAASAYGQWINWFSMNVKKAPWNDIHVRRAVAYALNRTDMIRALGGYATPVTTLVPPAALRQLGSQAEVNKLVKSLPQYPFDLAKAKEEMAKSAYPNGFTTTTKTFAAFGLPEVHQVIRDQLKQIGIDWRFELVPTLQWVAYINGPRDQIDSMEAYSNSPSPEPGFIPSFLLGSKNAVTGKANRANYTPLDVDGMIADGVKTADPAKRLEAYRKLLRRLAVDLPYIPTYVLPTHIAVSDRFAYQGTPFSLAFYGIITTWPQELVKPR
jgi:peptide/nickel transport system substrate-binding protein